MTSPQSLGRVSVGLWRTGWRGFRIFFRWVALGVNFGHSAKCAASFFSNWTDGLQFVSELLGQKRKA